MQHEFFDELDEFLDEEKQWRCIAPEESWAIIARDLGITEDDGLEEFVKEYEAKQKNINK